MEELVWPPDTALSLPILKLGKNITERVKKDPFQYGITQGKKSSSNGVILFPFLLLNLFFRITKFVRRYISVLYHLHRPHGREGRTIQKKVSPMVNTCSKLKSKTPV